MAVALIAIAALATVACVALLLYRDFNLHHDRHLIDKTYAAGYSEKQYASNNGIINYAEGPDNGPALLLVHGQSVAWQDYMKVLPELVEDFHVFAIDCYGHGKSEHNESLYTLRMMGDDMIAFANDVIAEPYVVTGHSSGGIIAAYIAAYDPEMVASCVLEDPPFFNVLPEEVQEGAGSFVWFDGYVPAHEYVEEQPDVPYPVFCAERSYLFTMFGGLKDEVVQEVRTWCEEHPNENVATTWIPQGWTRGLYFMNDFDPAFGNAFYTGSWLEDVEQAELLSRIKCPVIYLKAKTNYGDDGVLYAANTDKDAERLTSLIANCEMREVNSGHDIHYEKPEVFIEAIRDARTALCEAL